MSTSTPATAIRIENPRYFRLCPKRAPTGVRRSMTTFARARYFCAQSCDLSSFSTCSD